MLKLAKPRTEPLWIDFVPGARLQIAPIGTIDILTAREAAAAVYRADREAETKDPAVQVAATVAMTTAFARRVIRAWEGIGDEDGEPIDVTPEAVDRLMEVHAAYDAFDSRVLTPVLNGLPIGAA